MNRFHLGCIWFESRESGVEWSGVVVFGVKCLMWCLEAETVFLFGWNGRGA
jgi:hypothetical protein